MTYPVAKIVYRADDDVEDCEMRFYKEGHGQRHMQQMRRMKHLLFARLYTRAPRAPWVLEDEIEGEEAP